MSTVEAVLFANEAFYRAFADRDTSAMERLWATDSAVSCIHPGWNPIHGRSQVMQSWIGILTGPGSPQILCRNPKAWTYGEVAIVICFEEIDHRFLAATNVFRWERGSWKLVHHQAGPAEAPPQEIQDDSPELLN